MSGFIAMSRDALEHPLLQDPERFRAWFWLIANAAWRPTRTRIKGEMVDIERGELTFSQRFLAEKWGWSKSRVDRFISDLRAEGMIATRSKIGAESGATEKADDGATSDHKAGQGQSIITICNYNKYQSSQDGERGNVRGGDRGDDMDDGGATSGATAGQQRGKEEQDNKITNTPPTPSSPETAVAEAGKKYVFEGRTIRLNQRDFGQWAKSYSAIPDLKSELQSLDDWLQGEGIAEAKRKNWFQTVSALLGRKHEERLKAMREQSAAERAFDARFPKVQRTDEERRLLMGDEEFERWKATAR